MRVSWKKHLCTFQEFIAATVPDQMWALGGRGSRNWFGSCPEQGNKEAQRPRPPLSSRSRGSWQAQAQLRRFKHLCITAPQHCPAGLGCTCSCKSTLYVATMELMTVWSLSHRTTVRGWIVADAGFWTSFVSPPCSCVAAACLDSSLVSAMQHETVDGLTGSTWQTVDIPSPKLEAAQRGRAGLSVGG